MQIMIFKHDAILTSRQQRLNSVISYRYFVHIKTKDIFAFHNSAVWQVAIKNNFILPLLPTNPLEPCLKCKIKKKNSSKPKHEEHGKDQQHKLFLPKAAPRTPANGSTSPDS
jgi:hypothetical protein